MQHPEPEQLQAFGRGMLDESLMERIGQHVESCDECCRRLADLPRDELLSRLREVDTDLPWEETLGAPVPGAPAPAEGRIPAALRDHPRYRVTQWIGRGGMGDVFRAEHRVMGMEVALKVIRPELVEHRGAVRRFRKEVQAAARLNHINIVTAHDAEQADDLHFLVMEFVDGESLDRIVARRGPLPVLHCCNYARQTALGLQHAHQQGVVHRDIKPQNLMLTARGRVKILDFGLARLGQPDRALDSSLTDHGATLGTPDYVAPEQIVDASRVDERVDLYSLGCTLFFLLTGRVPFGQQSAVEKMHGHLRVAPPPLDRLRPETPEEVVRLVKQLMAKSPDDRPRSAAEVAERLAPFAKPRKDAVPSRAGGPADAEQIVALDAIAAAADSASEAGDNVAALVAGSGETKPGGSATGPRDRGRKVMLPAWSRRRVLAWGATGIGGLLVGGTGWLLVSRGLLPTPKPAPPPSPSPSPPPVTAPPRSAPRILLVIPPRHVWYPDYGPLKSRLEQWGARVEVASSEAGSSSSLVGQGVPGPEIPPDVQLRQVRGRDYDAVAFVGYAVNDYLPGEPAGDDVRRLIEQALQRPRPAVGSICAANAVLARHGFLKDRKAAGNRWANEVGAQAEDARWQESPLVTDGPFLTAQSDRDVVAFAKALFERAAGAGERQ